MLGALRMFAVLLLLPSRPARAADSQPVTIPLEVLRTGHIAVKVKLNGAGPFRMILDTGAPMIIISAQTASKLGLITESEAKQPAMAGLRSLGTLKSAEIGGAKAAGLPVLILDHPTLDMMGQVVGPLDGIVGYSFIARYRTTLDYQAKTVTFAPTKYEPEEVFTSLMRRVMSGDSPRRVIAPSGLWGMAVEKTGAESGVVVTKVFEGSAAAEAGLRAGDRLTTIDGRWTDSVRECYEAAELAKPGESVPVTLLRDGKETRIEVKPRVGL